MKRKGIHLSLMRDYLLFYLGISLILVLVFGWIVVEIIRAVDKGQLEATQNAQATHVVARYPSLDMKPIVEHGGWIEILDAQKRVIEIKGVKQDKKTSYSEAELYSLTSTASKDPFYYSLAPFTDHDRQRYLLLKFPRENVETTIQFPNASDEDIEAIASKIFVGVFLIPGSFLIVLIGYSYWTARRISKPLRALAAGLVELSEGEYSVRVKLRAEKEFAQIAEQFNHMAERLETLQQEKSKLEESKQKMLMDISHDLKTPMTTILGYARALDEGIVEDEQKRQRYIHSIFEKSQRAASLIDNLFELTKLDFVDFKLDKQDQDIVEFMRQLLAEHYEEMEEKQFVLDMNLPNTPVICLFDKRHMARAISNLINNAMLYNDKGTRLRVEIRSEKNGISIEIADNGTGIPEAIRPTIFDPFVRGDESRRTSGGTGLGMAISKKIVEKHGGTIELKQNGQEKTIIRLCLP